MFRFGRKRQQVVKQQEPIFYPDMRLSILSQIPFDIRDVLQRANDWNTEIDSRAEVAIRMYINREFVIKRIIINPYDNFVCEALSNFEGLLASRNVDALNRLGLTDFLNLQPNSFKLTEVSIEFTDFTNYGPKKITKIHS